MREDYFRLSFFLLLCLLLCVCCWGVYVCALFFTNLNPGTLLFSYSGPSFFDSQWLSRIKRDCGDNWRLKVSNLKKVHKGIMDYYNDVSMIMLPGMNGIPTGHVCVCVHKCVFHASHILESCNNCSACTAFQLHTCVLHVLHDLKKSLFGIN